MQNLHATIEGKVQGVFFRAWTKDAALDLGLVGWVRNQSDGNVEVMAQGSQETLKTFEAKLNMGPPLSRVSRVCATMCPASEPFEDFIVRR